MTPTISIGTAEEHDEAMPIRAVMTMPPDWLAEAFFAAVERAKVGATDVLTAKGISVPVAEALMWIDALRQTTREVGRGRDEARTLAQDPFMKALIFARGRVHHHWAPIAYLDVDVWVWLRAENLPLPQDPTFASPRGERLYKAHLEGQPVLATLEEAVRRVKALI
jgi:hypothetical protein